MKRRIPLSAAILIPVLLGVLLVQVGSFVGAYLAARNADINDATDIDQSALQTASRRIAMCKGEVNTIVEETKKIYEANPMDAMPADTDARNAYRRLFFGINNLAQYERVSTQVDYDTIGDYSDFFILGFVDAPRNRFVVVLAKDHIGGILPRVFTGYFFDLPEGCKTNAFFSGNLISDPMRELNVDGTFQNSVFYTSGLPTNTLSASPTSWMLRQTNEKTVFNESTEFVQSFAWVAVTTFVTTAILSFAAIHFGLLRPIKKLSSRSDSYVQAVAAGRLEDSFSPSQQRYTNEILTLNDSLYYMQEEIKGYTHSIKEATAREQRAAADLALAEKIQASMTPSEPLIGDTFTVNPYIKPAKEVGGDFYDYFPIDEDHIGFFIADVSGKGVPAALFMAKAAAVSKLLVGQHNIGSINDILAKGNEENLFVTAFFGVLNIHTGELNYTNCGHEPVFIRRHGKFEALEAKPNLPLGCLEGIEYQSQSTTLDKGDVLFLYTDGLSEAMNEAGELMGKEAILEALQNLSTCPGEAIIEGMKEAQAAFVKEAPQSDDTCFICVEFGERKTLQIPANKDGLKKVAGFIDDALEGYDFVFISSLQVVLDEFVSNVVFYSGASRITLTLLKHENDVEITIFDDGKPFDPLTTKVVKGKDEPGGFGIGLASNMVDEREYRRIGIFNLLRLKKIA